MDVPLPTAVGSEGSRRLLPFPTHDRPTDRQTDRRLPLLPNSPTHPPVHPPPPPSGISLRNLHIAALRCVFTTLERRFPERLAAIYMLDAPTIFSAAWHIIEPFIDK